MLEKNGIAAGNSAGGNGGDLRYAKSIPVTPGEVLSIVVAAANGLETCIKRGSTALLSAGNQGGFSSTLSTNIGGGNGGVGGTLIGSGYGFGSGGGGAGGYSDNGGIGARASGSSGGVSASSGFGGGGGGGGGGQVGDNSFLYEAFNAPASVVLAAGDRLVYDVRTVDPNVLFGLDALLTNTSSVSHAMRNCGILAWTKIVDQNGYDIHPVDARPSAKSSTDWYTRSFNLNAYAGYTLSNFAYGFESDIVNGPQVGYLRNARVESNVGVVKLVILGGEIVTAANTPWIDGMDTSLEPGLKNYDFIEKRMATMYDLWNVGI